VYISIVQNTLSSVALTHGSSNKSIFSLPVKVCRETDTERMLAGKLFHTTGSATSKLRVLSTVFVLETRHRLSEDWRVVGQIRKHQPI